MSPVEIIATACGVLCVWLTIRQNVWCWPVGLVQVTLFTWVFYRARLYSDVVLHVIYVALGIYGWYHWVRGGRDARATNDALPITRLRAGAAALWACAAAAVTAMWGYGMARFTDASLPYWDAAIAVLSLVAQFLLTRKVLENWLFWIVVDVLAVGVYAAKSLYLTAGLYALFLVLAVVGWLQWRRSFHRQAPNGVSTQAPAPPAATASSSASFSPRTAGTSS